MMKEYLEVEAGNKVGVFFKSENDLTTQYFIEVIKADSDSHVMVKIYTITDFQNYEIGDVTVLNEYEIEYIAEVDLWGKYFFPKFNNELQLYYNEEKYYGTTTRTDQIASLMEAINYAIDHGLKVGCIKPY